MKVFEMNDCDWFVGESLEACKAWWLKGAIEGIDDLSFCDGARELTDDELDLLVFTVIGENEVPDGTKRSFREQLAIEIAAGGAFPRLFATTEY